METVKIQHTSKFSSLFCRVRSFNVRLINQIRFIWRWWWKNKKSSHKQSNCETVEEIIKFEKRNFDVTIKGMFTVFFFFVFQLAYRQVLSKQKKKIL